MRKKTLLILVSVCALSMVTLISALTALYTFNVSMTATVASQGSVSILINSGNCTNGAPITLDWGAVQWGDNTKAITIVNNANTALTPGIGTSSLPSGWALTLSLNQAIPAGQNATGTLTLNVPTSTVAGSYSPTATITVSHS